MRELNFPSGTWIGFYNYSAGGRKHRMDLVLTFATGCISGDGRDDVGLFVISGRYDSGGECYWTKHYIRQHTVFYRSFREYKGIWGLWELWGGSGGFHIWPLGEEEGEREYEEAEEPLVEAVGSNTKLQFQSSLCHSSF
jgi:hypothetical protein